MISPSDGLLLNEEDDLDIDREEEAKAFLKQYADDYQEEQEDKMEDVIRTKTADPGDEAMYGKRSQDLKAKLDSGEINIV